MISIFNGPQGRYIAAEGLEQKLFLINNMIITFDGETQLRMLKNCEQYKNNHDELIEYLIHQNHQTIVYNDKNSVLVGDKKLYDISQGHHGKNVHAHITPNALNDFIDFVKHSQATQFGFILAVGTTAIFAPYTQLTCFYQNMHNSKNIQETIYSCFSTIIHETPYELPTFIANLCTLDSNEDLSHETLFDNLIRGTHYSNIHQKYKRDCEQYQQELDKLQDLVLNRIKPYLEKNHPRILSSPPVSPPVE